MSDVKKLYNALLSHGYTEGDLGDENTFTSAMADADNRKELYYGVRADGFDLGNYDDFEKRLTSDAIVETKRKAFKKDYNQYEE